MAKRSSAQGSVIFLRATARGSGSFPKLATSPHTARPSSNESCNSSCTRLIVHTSVVPYGASRPQHTMEIGGALGCWLPNMQPVNKSLRTRKHLATHGRQRHHVAVGMKASSSKLVWSSTLSLLGEPGLKYRSSHSAQSIVLKPKQSCGKEPILRSILKPNASKAGQTLRELRVGS